MGSRKKHRQAEDFEEKWRNRFRQFAKSNDDDAGIAGWSSSGLETRLRYFKREFGEAPKSGIWLDAGCGAGTYTRFLNSGEGQVIGVDYSYESVSRARQRPSKGILWTVADAKSLPFRRETFDGVLCFGVVQALSDSEPLISSLTSVTRENGTVWIDALNGWCLPNLWERLKRYIQQRPLHVRYESPFRLVALMRENGLADVRLYWQPILPQALQQYQWLMETQLLFVLFRFVPPLAALLSHSILVVGHRHARKPKRGG